MWIKKPWVIIGTISGIIAASIAILYIAGIDPSRFDIAQLQAKIRSYGAWGPAVYILFFQIRILFLVPLGALMMVAGLLWGLTGVWYVLIAVALYTSTEFLLARYLARDLARRILGDRLAFLDRYIAKNAFAAVFLLRLIPNVVLDIQNIGLALTSVRFPTYFAATLLGLLPHTVALAYFGDSLVGMLLQPGRRWPFILALALLLGLFAVQCYFRWKKGCAANPQEERRP